MGSLNRCANIPNIVEKYKIETFIETGLHLGKSMEKMISYDIERYGIELDKDRCDQCEKKFGAKVKIYNGYSKDKMYDILKIVSDGPILYWLDAHHPFDDATLDIPKEDKFPLELEMKIANQERDVSLDVFLVDDLRMYVDTDKPWVDRKKYGYDNYEHIAKILRDTHYIIEDRKRDEGYLMFFPKKRSEEVLKSCLHN